MSRRAHLYGPIIMVGGTVTVTHQWFPETDDEHETEHVLLSGYERICACVCYLGLVQKGQ